MSINIDTNVKNQGKAPALITGLDASKPSAGQTGRLFYATDTKIIYIDNGSSWVIFINGGGSSISVTDKYIPVANGANTLVNSVLYQNSGSVALNSTDITKGKFAVWNSTNRSIIAVINTDQTSDDFTSEVRFYGFDGSTINPLGQIYQTNNNQTTTSSFPNSINIKAFRTDGKIVFIVGGNNSSDIKGFINNSGNFIIGSLVDNGFGQKLQVTGGIYVNDLLNIGNQVDDYYINFTPEESTFFNNATGYNTKIAQGLLNVSDSNGDSIFQTQSYYDQTIIKTLNLFSLGNPTNISSGSFNLINGNANWGQIQYTGGALAANGTASCILSFPNNFPRIPTTQLTYAGLVSQHVGYSVTNASVGTIQINIHNLGLTSIPNNSIYINYLNIV